MVFESTLLRARSTSEGASLGKDVGFRELGLHFHYTGKLEKAYSYYRKSLRKDPLDYEIWCNLGIIYRRNRQFSLAICCYRRSLDLSPNNLLALSNLANVYKDIGEFQKSISLYKKALELKPMDTGILINYSIMYREAGKFEEALALLDRAKEIDPDNQNIEWERSQNLLYLGSYQEGLEAYESRWFRGVLPNRVFECPRWCGQELGKKTILVHAEQGFGDTIMAARFIRPLKELGANIILACQPDLHRLFSRLPTSLIDIALLDRNDLSTQEFDYHIPMMSLLKEFDVSERNVPPPAKLHVPLESKEKFRNLVKREENKLHIGIVWSGSTTFANNHKRAMKLEQLLSLLDLPDLKLFSFQKGEPQKELYDSGADILVHDLGEEFEDFADTAAAIELMDLIVMTDSSVAHLAGSLGVRVINLLDRNPYWIYAENSTVSSFYQSMTLLNHSERILDFELVASVRAATRNWGDEDVVRC